MKAARKRVTVALILMSVTLVLSSCARDPEKAKAKYLASGQNYMKQGQYASAAIEFRNALKIDPKFVDAYYQLAEADLAQRDFADAYASVTRAIELDPNRLDARLERGRLYVGNRNYDEAVKDAKFIVERDPLNVGAYELLASALIDEQKPEQALPALVRITELRPNDASAYVNLAIVEDGLHHMADAEQHFKKAVALDPKQAQANIDLAYFYRSQNKLPEAYQVLRTAIQNIPDAPSLYMDWAKMLLGEGKTVDANGIVDQLRTRMPNSADAAIAIGDYYIERHDLDKAVAEYRRGLSVSPDNLEIEKRIEDYYLATNQNERAAQMDSQLMKQAPKDVLVRVNHGRLLMAQGKMQDALIYLQKVVKGAPEVPRAHYFLALSHWQNGNRGEAVSEAQEALRISPGLALPLEKLAEWNLEQNKVSVAQTYAQELVQKHPDDPTGRHLLGRCLGQQGQLGPAEKQFLAEKLLEPNDSSAHLDLAQIYSAEKKWPEAQREYESAFQLDPHNPMALGLLADFLVARNQSPKAFSLVQQYVAANPNDSNGHVTLGVMNFDSKNYSAAEAQYKLAIQLDAKHVTAYERLGQVYQAEGQIDAAISSYQKALELQPKLPGLSAMVGTLYLDRGDLKTARQYYTKQLEIDPNYATANANMAWIDAEEGRDLDVALGMAQKAKSQSPEYPPFTDVLAWVMYKKGNYSGAIPLLEECLQKEPNRAVYHYHLGMALVATGQKEKGKAQLQAALQMKTLSPLDAGQAHQALTQVN